MAYLETVVSRGVNKYIVTYVCSYGAINKRSMMFSWGKGAKCRVYTEQQMLDEVYVEENRNRLAEAVRKAPANVLHKVDELLKAAEITP